MITIIGTGSFAFARRLITEQDSTSHPVDTNEERLNTRRPSEP